MLRKPQRYPKYGRLGRLQTASMIYTSFRGILNLWEKTWLPDIRCCFWLLICIPTRLVSSRVCPLHIFWWGMSTSWCCHPNSMSRNCGKTWANERCCHLHIYPYMRCRPPGIANTKGESGGLSLGLDRFTDGSHQKRIPVFFSCYVIFLKKRYRILFHGILGGWPTVGHTH